MITTRSEKIGLEYDFKLKEKIQVDFFNHPKFKTSTSNKAKIKLRMKSSKSQNEVLKRSKNPQRRFTKQGKKPPILNKKKTNSKLLKVYYEAMKSVGKKKKKSIKKRSTSAKTKKRLKLKKKLNSKKKFLHKYKKKSN